MASFVSSDFGYKDTAGGFSVDLGWVGNFGGAAESAYYTFSNVTVPRGATIISATLSANINNTDGSGTLALKIFGNAVDSAVSPTSAATYDALAVTTASTIWSRSNATLITYTTPDLSSIISEIVARGGWSSGNSLMVLVKDNGTASGIDADFGSLSNPVTLTISYVANSSIAQIAASVTAIGGTQSITTVNDVAIAQVAATVTASGGTQSVSVLHTAALSQVAATITASGGNQSVSGTQIFTPTTNLSLTAPLDVSLSIIQPTDASLPLIQPTDVSLSLVQLSNDVLTLKATSDVSSLISGIDVTELVLVAPAPVDLTLVA